ncbi:hypothetical protein HTZ77_36725 [Nonomuraea sp. SMC257]|uniref:Alanine-rich protein n=1 Tax=Nonomuraea montanisoli TaxID=2741721 RepID=A0A7Y6IF02_9ACTN|nr:hypothetical protein [Nonomuraea montanisoli]NUW36911.1 hypothetical protein [Nonomuraea montanisoli]
MNVAYVYPWDVVGDPAAPERLASLGVEAVALAASYHATRAATPHHPAHRVLDVPYAAFYLPVRASAWGRLVPKSPSWTTPDAYLQASDALRAAGLQVHAWTVLTHNSVLGREHPDVVVRNAFGDRYPHALCPSSADVVDYCRRLVREILEVGRPDALILESCGPMGYGHQSIHEKTAGADWTGVDGDLLSLCFCSTCASRYPTGTRERVRAAIDGVPAGDAPSPPAPGTPHDTPFGPTPGNPHEPTFGPTPGTPHNTTFGPTPGTPHNTTFGSAPGTPHDIPFGSVEDALGPLANDVRAQRVDLSASLRRTLISAAREAAPDVPITIHANPHPWATGAFAALPDGEPGAEVLVANCWGDPATDTARLARLLELCRPGQRVGAYVLGLPPRPADPEVQAELLRAYAKAGASEFHLYHVGLASPHRLSAMRQALRLID